MRGVISFLFRVKSPHGLLCGLYRTMASAAMCERFAAAASPGQGGAVRELLQGSYPRLAALLEDAFRRIHAETQVSLNITHPCRNPGEPHILCSWVVMCWPGGHQVHQVVYLSEAGMCSSIQHTRSLQGQCLQSLLRHIPGHRTRKKALSHGVLHRSREPCQELLRRSRRQPWLQ